MTLGRLRVSVIGAHTAAAETPQPYTVYRTVVSYQGQCYERLIRYREFRAFYKRVKLRNRSSPIAAEFPQKHWTRRTAMEDETIEARQVLLNEYMREICRKELTSASEDLLMKILKIGKYDDGTGRVSEKSFRHSMFQKTERPTLDVLHETAETDDDSGDKAPDSTKMVGGVATIVATTCPYRSVTSNATTVLTEDERSTVEERIRTGDEESMIALQEAIAEDARARDSPTREPQPEETPTASPTADDPKASKKKTPAYAGLINERPDLRASQSVAVRRGKHMNLPVPYHAPQEATSSEDGSASSVDPVSSGSLSPEGKYRGRISTQLSAISRLLSEGDGEEDDDLVRSFHRLAKTQSA